MVIQAILMATLHKIKMLSRGWEDPGEGTRNFSSGSEGVRKGHGGILRSSPRLNGAEAKRRSGEEADGRDDP
jgi:hypothetical protein